MSPRPTVRSHARAALCCLALGACPLSIPAAARTALPQGARGRAGLYVVENVRTAPDGEPVELVVDRGRIVEVRPAGSSALPGARVIDGQGGLALPAFVDAYGRGGLETPAPEADRDLPVSTESDVRIDMRSANRRGVQPALRAIDRLALGDKLAESAREAGFATLCLAPSGHLLPGASAVVTTRAAALREVVLDAEAFDHAELVTSEGGYPSTLMGCMAQLRQFFLDAERHGRILRRAADFGPTERPPYDADLEAALPILSGERRLVCHADSHRDVERWVRLADELGFELAITGGRDAWRVAALLAERRIPVVLTLDWGEEVDDPHAKDKQQGKKGQGEREDSGDEDEPEGEEVDAADEDEPAAQSGEDAEHAAEAAEPEVDWDYTEPLAVRVERRRLWEETRDCALRLSEAGVRFSLGSGGGSHADLLKHVRTLVEAGLPRDVALAALTSEGAAWLGLADELGALEPGRVASLGIWTGDPLVKHKGAKDAKLAWLFVEGVPYEFEAGDEVQDEGPPAEGVDASGTWTIEQEERGQTIQSTAVLEMAKDGAVTGTLTRPNPRGEGELEAVLEGRVSAKRMRLEGSLEVGDMDVTYVFEGELEGDAWTGTATVKGPWGEMERSFEATREPKQEARR